MFYPLLGSGLTQAIQIRCMFESKVVKRTWVPETFGVYMRNPDKCQLLGIWGPKSLAKALGKDMIFRHFDLQGKTHDRGQRRHGVVDNSKTVQTVIKAA